MLIGLPTGRLETLEWSMESGRAGRQETLARFAWYFNGRPPRCPKEHCSAYRLVGLKPVKWPTESGHAGRQETLARFALPGTGTVLD